MRLNPEMRNFRQIAVVLLWFEDVWPAQGQGKFIRVLNTFSCSNPDGLLSGVRSFTLLMDCEERFVLRLVLHRF